VILRRITAGKIPSLVGAYGERVVFRGHGMVVAPGGRLRAASCNHGSVGDEGRERSPFRAELLVFACLDADRAGLPGA